jgi:hypothetical protein
MRYAQEGEITEAKTDFGHRNCVNLRGQSRITAALRDSAATVRLR